MSDCDVDGDVEDKIAQALEVAKTRGDLPANAQQFVKKSLTDDPWQVLKQFIKSNVADDFSWGKLDKRFISEELYLPTLYSEGMGCMVVSIDTSGSTYSYWSQFATHVEKAVKTAKPKRLIVLHCDSQVDFVDDQSGGFNISVPESNFYGGGGTSFIPPFDWLRERGIQPDCMVYLTDCWGPFPKNDPGFPVLWASCSRDKAPWGRTIHICQ